MGHTSSASMPPSPRANLLKLEVDLPSSPNLRVRAANEPLAGPARVAVDEFFLGSRGLSSVSHSMNGSMALLRQGCASDHGKTQTRRMRASRQVAGAHRESDPAESSVNESD